MTTPDETPTTELIYQRTGGQVRVKLSNFTNHELREVMVGLWAKLDAADRDDFIHELEHYNAYLKDPRLFPARHLSPVAAAIANLDAAHEEN